MATKKEQGVESGGFKGFLLAAVGTCCLGLSIGFFLNDHISLKGETHAEPMQVKSSEVLSAAQTAGEGETQASDPSTLAIEVVSKGPFEVLQLPPIITNIAEPSKVWVRLEGSLLLDKSREADSTLLAARLAQHVMAYLNTLRLSDLQSAGAMYAVSEDLDEIVKSLSDGQVQGLLLSGLVFE